MVEFEMIESLFSPKTTHLLETMSSLVKNPLEIRNAFSWCEFPPTNSLAHDASDQFLVIITPCNHVFQLLGAFSGMLFHLLGNLSDLSAEVVLEKLSLLKFSVDMGGTFSVAETSVASLLLDFLEENVI